MADPEESDLGGGSSLLLRAKLQGDLSCDPQQPAYPGSREMSALVLKQGAGWCSEHPTDQRMSVEKGKQRSKISTKLSTQLDSGKIDL